MFFNTPHNTPNKRPLDFLIGWILDANSYAAGTRGINFGPSISSLTSRSKCTRLLPLTGPELAVGAKHLGSLPEH